MHIHFKKALALTGLFIAVQATAQLTFYENSSFEGQSFTTQRNINNLERFGFNNRASSVVVRGNANDRWEVCDDVRFTGRCVVLRRGEYSSLSSMGLNDRVSSVRNVGRNARIEDDRYAPAPVVPVAPQVTFYENDSYQGSSFTINSAESDFRRSGFNDRASSAVVSSGRWEVCENIGYAGQCVVLRPGQYSNLAYMGLNNRVSSVRALASNVRVDDGRYAPSPMVSTDYRRRNNEQLYQANVTSVRAVVDAPGQRCWVEQEQVAAKPNNSGVAGGVIGAVLGGILGHQVGGGSGKDVATGLGVVGGALIGNRVGRDNATPVTTTQNVQRCATAPQAQPTYWDVTYNFRGQEYRVQMTREPGSTVTVNEQGVPRA